MGNIKGRIAKLENRFGVNQEPENLEQMIEKFNRKEYGPPTVMSLVVEAINAKDIKGYFESLQPRYPEPFIACFLDGLILAMHRSSKGVGLREQRPGESKADYLKYQINECYLVVG